LPRLELAVIICIKITSNLLSMDSDFLESPVALTVAGLGTVAGGKGLYDAQVLANDLDEWEASADALKDRIKPYTQKEPSSKYKALQTTVKDAQEVFDNYYDHGHKILNRRVLGIPVHRLTSLADTPASRITVGADDDKVGALDAIGDKVKKLINGAEHYNVYADNSPGAKGRALRHHIKDILSRLKHTEDDLFANRPDRPVQFAELSDASKKIIANADTLDDMRSALARLRRDSELLTPDAVDKGLDFFDQSILGHASQGSGLAELVNGSKYVDGHTQEYIRHGRKALTRMRGGFGALAGLGALALGVGGYGALKKEASLLNREDSLSDAGKDALLAALSGGSLGAGAIMTPELINGTKALFGPDNHNIGFTYGKWGDIGEGHETPARNIKRLFTDEKTYKRLGLSEDELAQLKKIKTYDIQRTLQGVNPDAPLPKNFNAVFDTGLGLGRLDVGAPNGDGIWSPNNGSTVGYYRGENNRRRVGDGVWRDMGYSGGQRRLVDQAKGLNIDTTYHWLTDVPHSGSFGASMTGDDFEFLKGRRGNVAITYGPEEASAAMDKALLSRYNAKRWHLPNLPLSPALTAESADFLQRYPNKQAAIDAIRGALASDRSAFDRAADSTRNGDALGDILDFVQGKGKYTKPGRIVTIVGSGRGDYTVERALALTEALNRKGIDNVRVVPLLGNYVDDANLAPGEKFRLTNIFADRFDKLDDRIKSLGALYGDKATGSIKPYELLQMIADVNLGSTGTSAISETAHTGALTAIPRDWMDSAGYFADIRKDTRAATIRGLVGDVDAKFADGTTKKLSEVPGIGGKWVDLSTWNKGNINSALTQPGFMEILTGDGMDNKQWHNLNNFAKKFKGLFTTDVADPEYTNKLIRQQFRMDALADLLGDEDKLKTLQQRAMDAAADNMKKTTAAQKELVSGVLKNMRHNNFMNRLKGAGKMALPTALLGLGGAGLYNAMTD
jgi:hypothetical protein